MLGNFQRNIDRYEESEVVSLIDAWPRCRTGARRSMR